MLSRFIFRSSHLNHLAALISLKSNLVVPIPIPQHRILSNHNHYFFPRTPHISHFSTNGNNGNFGDDDSADSTTELWKITPEDEDINSIFSVDSSNTEGFNGRDDNGKIADPSGEVDAESWSFGSSEIDRDMEEKSAIRRTGGQVTAEDSLEWLSETQKEGGDEDTQLWSFSEEQKEQGEEDLFGIAEEEADKQMESGLEVVGAEKSEEDIELEMEAKALTSVLKGPERAFGDLIASSGITDDMLDSLIALKDFDGIEGLPPLSKIEELRYEKTTKKSSRYELERQKQEAVAQGRVSNIDEQGRAYGTGKRKCSIARVWINPGNGKFLINDREFDVYFPMIDHRAALLRPFSETKTLGLWDVKCTVKGGGTSGQVGAIRLGISRALQNWEPGFRPPLKEAGFLTRDSRIVERKKPGKAKARKSFQWVKR